MSRRLPISPWSPVETCERLSDVADSYRVPAFTDAGDLPVCKALQEPLAQLFSTRDQVLMMQRTAAQQEASRLNTAQMVGAWSNTPVPADAAALEWLLRDIEAIEAVCVRLWDEA